MRLFIRLLLGIMAGLLGWGQPSVASANGEHIHIFGDVGIPFIVVWIGGGLIVVLFLFFFIGWAYSSQAKKRSQEEEKGMNLPQGVKEEK